MSFWFDSVQSAMQQGSINVIGSTVKATLIDSNVYGGNPADVFLSDLPPGAQFGADQTLAGKSVSAAGIFTFDPVDWTGLVGAPSIGFIILYIDTGNPATSRLLYGITDAIGFPSAPGLTSARLTPDAVVGIWTVAPAP